MRYGKLIVLSTIFAFMLIVCLCFTWLFKVTETEIVVSGKETSEVYEAADKTLGNVALGKNLCFLSENKIRAELEKDPYIEVKSISKAFPSKIIVNIVKREERFAYFDGGSYYYADENFVYLKKSRDVAGDNVIKVIVTGKDFDFAGSALGKAFAFSSDDILGYTTIIANRIPDKFNLISEIKVDGVKNRLYFKTVTGASLEFCFVLSDPTVSPTDEEKRAVGKAICEKTDEVCEFYFSLDEAKKSKGYIYCLTLASGEIEIDYKESEPEESHG